MMDALVIAFRLPDIARKLFADGSLGISFLPVFTQTKQTDPQKAWTLLAVTLFWVFLCTLLFVVAGESLCWVALHDSSPESSVFFTARLTSLLLPYIILVSMAAICSAAMQAQGRFTVSTVAPLILNIVWLLGVLVIAPFLSSDPSKQCTILTLCILAAGIIQFLLHIPFLRSSGFHFRQFFPGTHVLAVASEVCTIFRDFFQKVFGLVAIHLNILTATWIAWFCSNVLKSGHTNISPLRHGAAAAVYFSERILEFPQGLFGLAFALALYPLLCRHAAQHDGDTFKKDLTLGLRIQLMFALPAGFGLMILSEPLVNILFKHGTFTESDAMRTADMIFWLGLGIGAFCVQPTMVRAFYALGNHRIPCRLGLASLLLNMVLGISLIFPMHDSGLTLALALTANIHSIGLLTFFAFKYQWIDIPSLIGSLCRTVAACGIMAAVILVILSLMISMESPHHGIQNDGLRILVCVPTGVLVFFFVHRLLGGPELSILCRGAFRPKE